MKKMSSLGEPEPVSACWDTRQKCKAGGICPRRPLLSSNIIQGSNRHPHVPQSQRTERFLTQNAMKKDSFQLAILSSHWDFGLWKAAHGWKKVPRAGLSVKPSHQCWPEDTVDACCSSQRAFMEWLIWSTWQNVELPKKQTYGRVYEEVPRSG